VGSIEDHKQVKEENKNLGIKVDSLNTKLKDSRFPLGLVINTKEKESLSENQRQVSLDLNNSPCISLGGVQEDGPNFLAEYNDLYEKFSKVEHLIEGPEFDLDYSYFFVD